MSRRLRLLFGELFRLGLQTALGVGQLPVFQLRGAIEVIGALGLLHFHLGLFDLLAQIAQAGDDFAFRIPSGPSGRRLRP